MSDNKPDGQEQVASAIKSLRNLILLILVAAGAWYGVTATQLTQKNCMKLAYGRELTGIEAFGLAVAQGQSKPNRWLEGKWFALSKENCAKLMFGGQHEVDKILDSLEDTKNQLNRLRR